MSADTPREEPNSPKDTSNQITLYVNNLPLNGCTQDEVKELFEQYGKVVNVTHRHNRKSGTFSGNSFVTFEKKEDGEKAIEELNNYEYKGRKLQVEQAKRPYQQDYKSKPNDQRGYRDEYDRPPRYVRYRDDRIDRQYPPRYSNDRGYYNPDPYYNDYYQDYDRRPPRYSGYRDYQDYDRRSRYRRDDVYESRQSRRSPTNYTRHQRSEEYDQ